MGKFSTKLLTLFAFVALSLGVFQTTKACDRSRLLLDSVSAGPGGTFNIHLQLCIGGGVLGLDKGADGQTGRFLFSFSSNIISCPGFNVNSFPSPITSDTIGVPYAGANVGPQPAFNATQAIFYNNSANWYACINSTVACGRPHTDCKALVFNVNCLPDSIRIYGIEGGDNLFGGCYPNFSMLIDFTVLPVEWANFEGKEENGGVGLNWTTLNESNNANFVVQRSKDGVDFQDIGSQEALGTSTKSADYEFFDPSPEPGINYYKIKQVDLDGQSSSTKTIAVYYTPPEGLAWRSVSPVPASDFVNLSFQSDFEGDLTFEVFDLSGRKVKAATVRSQVGVNDLQLDVREMNAGIYFLRIFSNQGLLEKKIVVAS